MKTSANAWRLTHTHTHKYTHTHTTGLYYGSRCLRGLFCLLHVTRAGLVQFRPPTIDPQLPRTKSGHCVCGWPVSPIIFLIMWRRFVCVPDEWGILSVKSHLGAHVQLYYGTRTIGPIRLFVYLIYITQYYMKRMVYLFNLQ